MKVLRSRSEVKASEIGICVADGKWRRTSDEISLARVRRLGELRGHVRTRPIQRSTCSRVHVASYRFLQRTKISKGVGTVRKRMVQGSACEMRGVRVN